MLVLSLVGVLLGPVTQDTARRPTELPLQATARSFRLETSRGTWMSLDLTPDGRTIVFDLLGDLYTMPVTGGRATRITSGLAFDAQPRVSPDGKQVVFVSDRGGSDHVWIMSLDLKDTVQITKGNLQGVSSPEWTPDGKAVVVTRGTSLWLHHVAGGTGVQLIRELLMSPAGDQALAVVGGDIYVVAVPYVGGQTPTVSVADSATAAVPVKKLTDIGGEFPAWRADGRKVHWSIGNAHVVYDLDQAKAAEQRIRIGARRDVPRQSLVLRGGRVITMNGREIIDHADVVIQDDRIVAVAPVGARVDPPNARVIDVTGKTIVPGFVDAHAHYRHSPGVHFGQPWAYLANLAFGVTTSRDP